jgi:hypothetical protein
MLLEGVGHLLGAMAGQDPGAAAVRQPLGA